MKPFRQIIYCLSILLLSIATYGQTKVKTDIIVKTSGEELKGEVKAMEDDVVKFTYTGETLLYTIKKDDIEKIIFSSGRVEIINDANSKNKSASTEPNAAIGDHHNKIAILPVGIVMDGQPMAEDMSLKVQNECFALLNKHTGEQTIIDNHLTNALLVKGGVNSQNISGFTMAELCNILGVEFIVTGIIIMDKTTATQYNSSTGSSSTKSSNDDKKSKSSAYGSSYSTSSQNYNTSVQFQIYNDKNESLYNQDRKAFWHQQDAYKSTLEYLIKRCPLYLK